MKLKCTYVFTCLLVLMSLGGCSTTNELLESNNEFNDPIKINQDVIFNKNIHNSLPISYVDEYNSIFNYLLSLLPVKQKYYTTVNVYAWQGNENSSEDNPYDGIKGGAYISGNGTRLDFVTEVSPYEFEHNSFHRFSVIAHEYFHIYQMYLSQNFFNNSFKIKWYSEGCAAVFESLFIQQKYKENYFLSSQNQVSNDSISNPHLQESPDVEDINYCNSVLFILILSKEVQAAKSISEAEAFRLIFKTFLEQNPTGKHDSEGNWKTVFNSTFGFSVDTFYEKVKTYTIQNEYALYSTEHVDLRPSPNLTLESIFN